MSDTKSENADSGASRHGNDIYAGNIEAPADASPAIPAATVILLRDVPTPEVLMVHKTSKIAFGGMWVFPGGRIDPEDHAEHGDPDTAARNAAARETLEEAGIRSRPEDFVWFSHWTPPASTPKQPTPAARFAVMNQPTRSAVEGAATTPLGKVSTIVRPSRAASGRVVAYSAPPSITCARQSVPRAPCGPV